MTDSLGAEREGPPWPADPSWRAWEQGGEWWVGNVAPDGALEMGEFFGPLSAAHASRLATVLRGAALPSAPREELLREALNVATDLASALFAMNGNACDDDATNALERWRKLLELEAAYLRVDRGAGNTSGAVPLSAPDGPWKIRRVEITTTPWRVSPDDPEWTWQILWFPTEAEAIAVRDALNRVGASPGAEPE